MKMKTLSNISNKHKEKQEGKKEEKQSITAELWSTVIGS